MEIQSINSYIFSQINHVNSDRKNGVNFTSLNMPKRHIEILNTLTKELVNKEITSSDIGLDRLKKILNSFELKKLNEIPKVSFNNNAFPQLLNFDHMHYLMYQLRNDAINLFEAYFHNNSISEKGFKKIAGMGKLKLQLREDIINPIKYQNKYKKYGLEQLNGCLFYGPPGCGKTFIANAIAEEIGSPLVYICPSNVGSIYQHETAKNIAIKFNQAKKHPQSIVFIDEAEAIVPSRLAIDNSIDLLEQVNEVLQQINNSKDKNIFVILASNEPQKIDNAIKRTGRIDKKIYIGPPDFEARKELLKRKLAKVYKSCDIDYNILAKKTENYIAEDLRMVLHNAGLQAMHKNSLITEEHILKAIEEVKPTLNEQMLNDYKKKGYM